MTLKITFGNHLRLLAFQIIGTILMILLLYFFHFEKNMSKIFFLLWLVYTVPAFYLHCEYFFKNRGQQLEISNGQVLFRNRNGSERIYKFEDLQKIVLYKSASLDKGGLQLSAVEGYHYARILPRQGEEIILTCLMAPNLEEVIKQIKWVAFERKKRLFASLNFSIRLFPDK